MKTNVYAQNLVTQPVKNNPLIQKEDEKIFTYLFLHSLDFFSGFYGLRKAAKSLNNVFGFKKFAYSLSRLIGIGTGAYFGMMDGATLGTIIGFSVPVVGPAAGALIGALIGAGVGSSIGAFFSKLIGQCLSAIFNISALQPTNPGKYKLTFDQELKLSAKQFDLDVVREMIKTIHTEKSHLGAGRYIPFTYANALNKHFNELLDALKHGELQGPVTIAGVTFNPIKNIASDNFTSSHARLADAGMPLRSTPKPAPSESEVLSTAPANSRIYPDLDMAAVVDDAINSVSPLDMAAVVDDAINSVSPKFS